MSDPAIRVALRPRPLASTPPRTWTAAALDGLCDVTAAAKELPWTCTEQDAAGASFVTRDGVTVHLLRLGAVVVAAGPIPPDIAETLERASGRRLESATTWRIDFGNASEAARVNGRQLVLSRDDAVWLRTAALVLAESAALTRGEAIASQLLEDAKATAEDLRGAHLPWSSRRATRQTGTLLRARLELAGWPQVGPEDCGDKERLRAALAEGLDLPQRRAALQARLTATEDTLQTMLELWHGRRSRGLEWIIILLIAFDIALCLVRYR